MTKAAKKIISLMVLICFAMTQTATANPGAGVEIAPRFETPSFLQIDIPSELATLDGLYESPARPDPKFILHIQNAHANYGAQEKIKQLLQYLEKTYDIKTIFVEGASEDLNPEYLRFFPDAERNKKLADYLAKQGELTGAEMYLLEADVRSTGHEPRSPKGVGIEDAALYRENYEALKKVFGSEATVNKYLNGFEARLDKLGSKVFMPELRKLLMEWKKFEKGHREFMPYVRALAVEAKKILKTDLESLLAQVEWPQITRLLVLQQMEKELDMAKGIGEKDAVVKFLREKKVSKTLITAVENFQDQRISVANSPILEPGSRMGQNGALVPRDLMEQLVMEAGPKGFRFSDYPEFSLYAGYVILKSELDPKGLFDEIGLLFRKILDELAKTDQQKALLDLYRDEELVRKLLNLELTRKNWNEVLGRKERLEPEVMVTRLKEMSVTESKDSTTESENSAPKGGKFSEITDIQNAAYTFYDAARRREEVFYAKIDETMRKGRISKAVLVTGGFHTDGITELLREHEISYGILTPRLSEKSDEHLYRSLMLQNQPSLFELSYLEPASWIISWASQMAQVGKAQMPDRLTHFLTQIGVALDLPVAEVIRAFNEKFGASQGITIATEPVAHQEGRLVYPIIFKSGLAIPAATTQGYAVGLKDQGAGTVIPSLELLQHPAVQESARLAQTVGPVMDQTEAGNALGTPDMGPMVGNLAQQTGASPVEVASAIDLLRTQPATKLRAETRADQSVPTVPGTIQVAGFVEALTRMLLPLENGRLLRADELGLFSEWGMPGPGFFPVDAAGQPRPFTPEEFGKIVWGVLKNMKADGDRSAKLLMPNLDKFLSGKDARALKAVNYFLESLPATRRYIAEHYPDHRVVALARDGNLLHLANDFARPEAAREAARSIYFSFPTLGGPHASELEGIAAYTGTIHDIQSAANKIYSETTTDFKAGKTESFTAAFIEKFRKWLRENDDAVEFLKSFLGPQVDRLKLGESDPVLIYDTIGTGKSSLVVASYIKETHPQVPIDVLLGFMEGAFKLSVRDDYPVKAYEFGDWPFQIKSFDTSSGNIYFTYTGKLSDWLINMLLAYNRAVIGRDEELVKREPMDDYSFLFSKPIPDTIPVQWAGAATTRPEGRAEMRASAGQTEGSKQPVPETLGFGTHSPEQVADIVRLLKTMPHLFRGLNLNDFGVPGGKLTEKDWEKVAKGVLNARRSMASARYAQGVSYQEEQFLAGDFADRMREILDQARKTGREPDRKIMVMAFGVGNQPMEGVSGYETYAILRAFSAAFSDSRLSELGEDISKWKLTYLGFDINEKSLGDIRESFSDQEGLKKRLRLTVNPSGIFELHFEKADLFYPETIQETLKRLSLEGQKADYVFERNMSYANSAAALLTQDWENLDDVAVAVATQMVYRNILLTVGREGTRYVLESTQHGNPYWPIYVPPGMLPLGPEDRSLGFLKLVDFKQMLGASVLDWQNDIRNTVRSETRATTDFTNPARGMPGIERPPSVQHLPVGEAGAATTRPGVRAETRAEQPELFEDVTLGARTFKIGVAELGEYLDAGILVRQGGGKFGLRPEVDQKIREAVGAVNSGFAVRRQEFSVGGKTFSVAELLIQILDGKIEFVDDRDPDDIYDRAPGGHFAFRSETRQTLGISALPLRNESRQEEVRSVASQENLDIDRFIEELKKLSPVLAQSLSGPTGTEFPTLEAHVRRVLEYGEELLSRLPPNISPVFFRLLLAIHDVGKPSAVQKGSTEYQHLETERILRDSDLFNLMGFTMEESRLAIALLKEDPIGKMIQGAVSSGSENGDRVDFAAVQIRSMTMDSGASEEDFFTLLTLLFSADVSSYLDFRSSLFDPSFLPTSPLYWELKRKVESQPLFTLKTVPLIPESQTHEFVATHFPNIKSGAEPTWQRGNVSGFTIEKYVYEMKQSSGNFYVHGSSSDLRPLLKNPVLYPRIVAEARDDVGLDQNGRFAAPSYALHGMINDAKHFSIGVFSSVEAILENCVFLAPPFTSDGRPSEDFGVTGMTDDLFDESYGVSIRDLGILFIPDSPENRAIVESSGAGIRVYFYHGSNLTEGVDEFMKEYNIQQSPEREIRLSGSIREIPDTHRTYGGASQFGGRLFTVTNEKDAVKTKIRNAQWTAEDYLKLARAQLAIHAYEETTKEILKGNARKYAQKALELDTNNVKAYILLGDVAENFEERERYYRKALELGVTSQQELHLRRAFLHACFDRLRTVKPGERSRLYEKIREFLGGMMPAYEELDRQTNIGKGGEASYYFDDLVRRFESDASGLILNLGGNLINRIPIDVRQIEDLFTRLSIFQDFLLKLSFVQEDFKKRFGAPGVWRNSSYAEMTLTDMLNEMVRKIAANYLWEEHVALDLVEDGLLEEVSEENLSRLRTWERLLKEVMSSAGIKPNEHDQQRGTTVDRYETLVKAKQQFVESGGFKQAQELYDLLDEMARLMADPGMLARNMRAIDRLGTSIRRIIPRLSALSDSDDVRPAAERILTVFNQMIDGMNQERESLDSVRRSKGLLQRIREGFPISLNKPEISRERIPRFEVSNAYRDYVEEYIRIYLGRESTIEQKQARSETRAPVMLDSEIHEPGSTLDMISVAQMLQNPRRRPEASQLEGVTEAMVREAAESLGYPVYEWIQDQLKVHQVFLPILEKRLLWLLERHEPNRPTYVFIGRDAEMAYDALKMMAGDSELANRIKLVNISRPIRDAYPADNSFLSRPVRDYLVSEGFSKESLMNGKIILIDSGFQGSIFKYIAEVMKVPVRRIHEYGYLFSKTVSPFQLLGGEGPSTREEIQYKSLASSFYAEMPFWVRNDELACHMQLSPKYTDVAKTMAPDPERPDRLMPQVEFPRYIPAQTVDPRKTDWANESIVDPVGAMLQQIRTCEYFSGEDVQERAEKILRSEARVGEEIPKVTNVRNGIFFIRADLYGADERKVAAFADAINERLADSTADHRVVKRREGSFFVVQGLADHVRQRLAQQLSRESATDNGIFLYVDRTTGNIFIDKDTFAFIERDAYMKSLLDYAGRASRQRRYKKEYFWSRWDSDSNMTDAAIYAFLEVAGYWDFPRQRRPIQETIERDGLFSLMKRPGFFHSVKLFFERFIPNHFIDAAYLTESEGPFISMDGGLPYVERDASSLFSYALDARENIPMLFRSGDEAYLIAHGFVNSQGDYCVRFTDPEGGERIVPWSYYLKALQTMGIKKVFLASCNMHNGRILVPPGMVVLYPTSTAIRDVGTLYSYSNYNVVNGSAHGVMVESYASRLLSGRNGHYLMFLKFSSAIGFAVGSILGVLFVYPAIRFILNRYTVSRESKPIEPRPPLKDFYEIKRLEFDAPSFSTNIHRVYGYRDAVRVKGGDFTREEKGVFLDEAKKAVKEGCERHEIEGVSIYFVEGLLDRFYRALMERLHYTEKRATKTTDILLFINKENGTVYVPDTYGENRNFLMNEPNSLPRIARYVQAHSGKAKGGDRQTDENFYELLKAWFSQFSPQGTSSQTTQTASGGSVETSVPVGQPSPEGTFRPDAPGTDVGQKTLRSEQRTQLSKEVLEKWKEAFERAQEEFTPDMHSLSFFRMMINIADQFGCNWPDEIAIRSFAKLLELGKATNTDQGFRVWGLRREVISYAELSARIFLREILFDETRQFFAERSRVQLPVPEEIAEVILAQPPPVDPNLRVFLKDQEDLKERLFNVLSRQELDLSGSFEEHIDVAPAIPKNNDVIELTIMVNSALDRDEGRLKIGEFYGVQWWQTRATVTVQVRRGEIDSVLVDVPPYLNRNGNLKKELVQAVKRWLQGMPEPVRQIPETLVRPKKVIEPEKLVQKTEKQPIQPDFLGQLFKFSDQRSEVRGGQLADVPGETLILRTDENLVRFASWVMSGKGNFNWNEKHSGWKLHIKMEHENAQEIAKTIRGILEHFQVPFKVVATLDDLRRMNRQPPPQNGKGMVVYWRSEDARNIDKMLNGALSTKVEAINQSFRDRRKEVIMGLLLSSVSGFLLFKWITGSGLKEAFSILTHRPMDIEDLGLMFLATLIDRELYAIGIRLPAAQAFDSEGQKGDKLFEGFTGRIGYRWADPRPLVDDPGHHKGKDNQKTLTLGSDPADRYRRPAVWMERQGIGKFLSALADKERKKIPRRSELREKDVPAKTYLLDIETMKTTESMTEEQKAEVIAKAKEEARALNHEMGNFMANSYVLADLGLWGYQLEPNTNLAKFCGELKDIIEQRGAALETRSADLLEILPPLVNRLYNLFHEVSWEDLQKDLNSLQGQEDKLQDGNFPITVEFLMSNLLLQKYFYWFLASHLVGVKEIQSETIRLATMLQSVVNISDSLRNQVEISEELQSTDQKIELTTDGAALAQVMLNLWRNAHRAVEMKFGKNSSEGKIHVVIKQVSDSSIVVTIKDNGVGMSDEVRKKALSESVTTKETKEGHGIGLMVVAGLVKSRLGGTILVESKKGEGTVFTLQLPVDINHPVKNIPEEESQRSETRGMETPPPTEVSPASSSDGVASYIAVNPSGYKPLDLPSEIFGGSDTDLIAVLVDVAAQFGSSPIVAVKGALNYARVGGNIDWQNVSDFDLTLYIPALAPHGDSRALHNQISERLLLELEKRGYEMSREETGGLVEVSIHNFSDHYDHVISLDIQPMSALAGSDLLLNYNPFDQYFGRPDAVDGFKQLVDYSFSQTLVLDLAEAQYRDIYMRARAMRSSSDIQDIQKTFKRLAQLAYWRGDSSRHTTYLGKYQDAFNRLSEDKLNLQRLQDDLDKELPLMDPDLIGRSLLRKSLAAFLGITLEEEVQRSEVRAALDRDGLNAEGEKIGYERELIKWLEKAGLNRDPFYAKVLSAALAGKMIPQEGITAEDAAGILRVLITAGSKKTGDWVGEVKKILGLEDKMGLFAELHRIKKGALFTEVITKELLQECRALLVANGQQRISLLLATDTSDKEALSLAAQRMVKDEIAWAKGEGLDFSGRFEIVAMNAAMLGSELRKFSNRQRNALQRALQGKSELKDAADFFVLSIGEDMFPAIQKSLDLIGGTTVERTGAVEMDPELFAASMFAGVQASTDKVAGGAELLDGRTDLFSPVDRHLRHYRFVVDGLRGLASQLFQAMESFRRIATAA